MAPRQVTAQLPPDFGWRQIAIWDKVHPYTMTGPIRIYSLIEAVRYIVKNDIPGDFLECGVYKGGSMMAVALTLMSMGVSDRKLWLFDTFAGMPKPEDVDVNFRGKPAIEKFSRHRIDDESSTWVNVPLEDVRDAMRLTGYPEKNINYIKGMVEDTIPGQAPELLALLRLDTDWYRSTKHEMVHLYPRVSSKGVVIVDDYAFFKGAQKAVDEYLAENDLRPMLHRIDYSARLIVKD